MVHKDDVEAVFFTERDCLCAADCCCDFHFVVAQNSGGDHKVHLVIIDDERADTRTNHAFFGEESVLHVDFAAVLKNVRDGECEERFLNGNDVAVPARKVFFGRNDDDADVLGE